MLSAAHAQAAPPAGDEQAVPVPLGADAEPGAHQLLVMLRLPASHYRPDASYGGRYIDDSGRASRHRRAEALARQHGLTLVDDWPMPVLGLDCYVMRYAEHTAAGPLIEALSRDPQVEWAQPVAGFSAMAQIAATTTAPNGNDAARAVVDGAPARAADGADALYPVQPAARYWHLADLHRYATGRDVKVAVIDSGIDANHPDLRGQLAVNNNFVDNGPAPPENHGTAVAGIIAARAGNGGIVGVAPQAKLMGLRACWQQRDQTTRCNSFTLSKAIHFAILNGARVINLSLSGPPDRLLDRLLDVALERGIGVVGAIDAQASGPAFPSSHRGVLAVAAQARAGGPPAGTPSDALLAPGNDVPTTMPGGRWSFVNGSSYAAAHVSGMVALLDQLQPASSPAQLRTLLTPAGSLNAGNIDACVSLSRLIRDFSCARTLSQRGATP
ncbi:peptidase S8 and S53 subtilisin kexin sedolisin [Duganella callida]|uniref:Peptidase S8 and S53 subtilisin kexin sedolisin n=2 Tax=Duganella callida TaxID=2561932 RepID=A0A4Y9SXH4_9BURK|nr:peptidase S8 and S53 subtilisin kexin sedolisin [Duganella callida]